MSRSRRSLMALVLCAPLLHLAPAAAQQAPAYPSHPIRFIVPFAPGSVTDVSARWYAKQLTTLAGQPVFVENRPGANGLNGVQAMTSSPADGYTILIGTTSVLATNVALYRKLPYDPIADFSPLGAMSQIPTVIVTGRDARCGNLRCLVDAAKAAPGKLNYSAGATSYQLMGELFNERSAIQTAFIPYKGSSEALNAVLGGQVDFSVLDMSTALASLKGGTLKALAVAADQRSGLLPDVPTAIESGVPDYVASTWVAAVVTSKTPPKVVEQLQGWFSQIAGDPETRKYLLSIGADTMPGGPSSLRALQQQSIDLWRRVATNAKIELL